MDAPLLVSRFLVEVADLAVPVSEVHGLAYAPAERPPATVTLRRAAGSDPRLLDWARQPAVRSVRVSLLRPGGDPAVAYLLLGARPIAWRGPELDASSPEIAVEELVLAVDRIDLQ